MPLPSLAATDVEPLVDEELLAPGTHVGEYVIEALLGAGGFARVYRARHATLRARFAVKVLSRGLASDHQVMTRFVREAQAATRIVHPNVVRVLGFGRHDDGRAYQVMDLVEGSPLDHLLAEVGALPVAEALALLDGIGAGLAAAHAAGIVHRDLKPANVLLAGAERVPRLADFGIAKAIEGDEDQRLTQTGVTLGTPVYMSPEQALGRAVSDASDVYALGVVAFEVLTGAVPFEGATPFETMMMHVQAAPPAASALRPGLPASLDAPLARMLAKDPAARPRLAAALAELRAAASGAPVEALAPSEPELAPPPAREPAAVPPPARRRLAAVSLAVLLLAAAAGAWLLTRARPPVARAPAVPPGPGPGPGAPAPAPVPTATPTPTTPTPTTPPPAMPTLAPAPIVAPRQAGDAPPSPAAADERATPAASERPPVRPAAATKPRPRVGAPRAATPPPPSTDALETPEGYQ